MVARTLEDLNAARDEVTGIRRYEEGDWNGPGIQARSEGLAEVAKLEPYFGHEVPIYAMPEAVLSPSDLGGAKVIGGDREENLEKALAFGTAVHQLLEVLPALHLSDREQMASKLAHDIYPEDAGLAAAQAMAVLKEPNLAYLFEDGSLAEVPLTAEVGGRRLHGVIDRLIIGHDAVMAVDFKSNRVVPDRPEVCPEGILRQMGAYAAMLAQIYPKHSIGTAVLWTQTAQLMVLPSNLTDHALARCPDLDVSPSHP